MTPSIVTTESGLFGISVNDGTDTQVLGVGGKGLTLAEAREVLDWLENRNILKQPTHEPSNGFRLRGLA